MVNDSNYTNVNETLIECIRSLPIKKVDWYRFMLIPASLWVFLLSFLRTRRNLRLKCWNGRPGLPRPLHFLDDKRNRLFYVGGFSVTVWMLQECIIGSMNFGIPTTIYYEYWVEILSTTLIAIICYPIFAGVSSEHVIGYALGTVYMWALTISFIILHLPCENRVTTKTEWYAVVDSILHFIKFLPCLFWMFYLSFNYSWRLIGLVRNKIKDKDDPEKFQYLIYVRRLLAKPKDQISLVATKPNFVKKWASIGFRKIYSNIQGFRYSVSIMSAVFASILLVYTVAITVVELLFRAEAQVGGEISYKFLEHYKGGDGSQSIGKLYVLDEFFRWVFSVARKMGILLWVKVAFILSINLGFGLTTVSLLLTLKGHRQNLLNCYKGNVIDLPSYRQSSRSVMVHALSFIGYQLASAVWGFVVQTAVISAALVGCVLLWSFLFRKSGERQDHDQNQNQNQLYRAVILVGSALFLYGIQHLVVHLFFMQKNDKGKRVLAINNRSCYVNFEYFMVFPNATIGIVTCFKRVLITTGFCLLALPRQDRCALGRHYEVFDNAYKSYIGLLKMEASLTNPTVLTFVHQLVEATKEAKTALVPAVHRSMWQKFTDAFFSLFPKARVGSSETHQGGRRKRIRNRWFLWITLHRNPGLRVLRKRRGPIIGVKEAESKSGSPKKPTIDLKSGVSGTNAKIDIKIADAQTPKIHVKGDAKVAKVESAKTTQGTPEIKTNACIVM